jgi:predicted transcriptional regulator
MSGTEALRPKERSKTLLEGFPNFNTSSFKVDIQQWTMIETLEKHSLISKSVLGDDIKYTLTDEGKKHAEKFI